MRSRAPAPEYYEPADPSRMPPKGLVIGALVFAALLIAAYFLWFSSYRSEQVPELEVPAEAPQAAPAQPAAPQAAADGPVTLTATGEVWLRVTDGPGGPQLFSGSLNAGQTYSGPGHRPAPADPHRPPAIAPRLGRRPRPRPARAGGARDRRRQPAAAGSRRPRPGPVRRLPRPPAQRAPGRKPATGCRTAAALAAAAGSGAAGKWAMRLAAVA